LGYATLGTIASRGYTGRLIRDLVREQLAGGQIANSTLYQRITFLAQAPAVAPPAAETEVVAEQPPASEEAPPSEVEPPAETAPAEQPAEAAAPPAEEHPAGEQPAAGQEGLDSLKYDRNGQPLTINDEVVQDTGSDAEAAPAEAAPAEAPAETAPPEVAAPPAEQPPATPAAAAGTLLGSARSSAAGLEYEFMLYTSDGGYEFQLKVTNSSSSPIELSYATNERFDFEVYNGTNLLWHYNINRFFVQSALTETIGAGEKIVYRGAWNGADKSGKALPPAQYHFEALHQLAAAPVKLGFDANLAR
jgi:hypothetical protein